MKVADSSFLAEALLKKGQLFKEEDSFLTVDLAVHEVSSAIWKHQYLLKDLEDGLPLIAILYGLIDSGKIRVVRAGRGLMERAYAMAGGKGCSMYDAIFVALAQELRCQLATFDKNQASLMM